MTTLIANISSRLETLRAAYMTMTPLFAAGDGKASLSLTAARRAQSVALLQQLANSPDLATPNQCAELRCLASRD